MLSAAACTTLDGSEIFGALFWGVVAGLAVGLALHYTRPAWVVPWAPLAGVLVVLALLA